jgi:hypothetical protein
VLQPIHQGGQRDPQRLGNGLDVPQSQVSFTPFDPADVRPVESAGRGKALLGIALLLAQLADSQSKSHQDVGSLSHANHWNVDNEYHSTDYEYHSRIDWNESRCPNGFSSVMVAIVIAESKPCVAHTTTESEHIFNQISPGKSPGTESQNGELMNANSTSTPGTESNGGHGDPKTPEQDNTFRPWLGRKVRTHVQPWHLVQILVAFVYVAIEYGLEYSVLQLAIGAIGVAGIVFVCWMGDDPVRARSAILFLFYVLILSLPVTRRILSDWNESLREEPTHVDRSQE